MAKCSQCDQPIEGNRYEDALSVGTSFSDPRRIGYDVQILHFECVEKVMSLTDLANREPAQFNKWAIWAITKERDQREALETKIQAEFELIHRALHALPSDMIVKYMEELYDSQEGDIARKAENTFDYIERTRRPPKMVIGSD